MTGSFSVTLTQTCWGKQFFFDNFILSFSLSPLRPPPPNNKGNGFNRYICDDKGIGEHHLHVVMRRRVLLLFVLFGDSYMGKGKKHFRKPTLFQSSVASCEVFLSFVTKLKKGFSKNVFKPGCSIEIDPSSTLVSVFFSLYCKKASDSFS